MTQESTIQPLAPGDILAGCTLLNNDEDDHAGDGRIIQYDENLNEKGALWLDNTTHLVGGLKFAPDGSLWAFDSQAFKVLRFDGEMKPLPVPDFPSRAFSNVNFHSDGSVLLGEHLVGDTIKLPPERPLGTTLPKMPGTDRFGDGHIYRFSADGDLLNDYASETHGGMPGFLGVTSTTLSPDGNTVVYVSETGPRIMRYDIANDEQLPDLITFAPDSKNMVITLLYLSDGRLLVIRANFETGFALEEVNDDGEVVRAWELPPGPGWATLAECTSGKELLVGNFFTGKIIKIDMESSEVLAQAETGVERSMAGIAQYPG